jgi:hypothetical protein
LLNVDKSSGIVGYELRMACCTLSIAPRWLDTIAENDLLHVDKSTENADYELRMAYFM